MRVLNERYQSVQDWTVHFIVFEDIFLKWKKTQSIVVHCLVVKTNGIMPSFNCSYILTEPVASVQIKRRLSKLKKCNPGLVLTENTL